jgi:hypothetical protein
MVLPLPPETGSSEFRCQVCVVSDLISLFGSDLERTTEPSSEAEVRCPDEMATARISLLD